MIFVLLRHKNTRQTPGDHPAAMVVFFVRQSRHFTQQFNIPTRQNHSKGVSAVNAGVNKATGAIKGQAVKHANQLLGENLKVERAALSKVKQVVSVAKSVSTIATAVTAGTNPASAAKAAIDLAVKAGKAIHAAAAGM